MTGLVRLVTTVACLVELSVSLTDITCPAPWPTPTTAVGRESCSCQRRSEDNGLIVRCSWLTYWPNETPPDTKELILDGTSMSEELTSYFLPGYARLLEHFSCQMCGIRTVKQFAFFGLNNLHTINLPGNQITTLESYAFSGLTGLRLINLASCGILTIDKMAFFNLKHLGRLDLSQNPLRNIQVNAFKNVSHVDQISFNQIEASELQSYSLKGLSHINLMSFTHSNIRKLEPYAFYGVDNVTTINFHSSQLKTISSMAFVGIGKVNTIKLKSTHISTLRCGALEGLNCVRTIHWDSSPIRCDCHIQWMVELSANISRDLTRSLRCASPYLFSGRSPFELDRDELGCNDDERYLGCAALDTRVPRVQPLERYIEEAFMSRSSAAYLLPSRFFSASAAFVLVISSLYIWL